MSKFHICDVGRGGPRLGPPLDIGHNSWAAILIRGVGDGSDDNKIGVIAKKAEYMCVSKKLFTTALWVFATAI